MDSITRVCGRRKNLSLNGAFVEMPGEYVTPQEDVEAILALADLGCPQRHHVAARVVRTGPGGVALMFRDYGNDTYTALARLLYAE
ncbi:MAG: PilZ domain-containing protein [Acidiferrobacterales bacterium]